VYVPFSIDTPYFRDGGNCNWRLASSSDLIGLASSSGTPKYILKYAEGVLTFVGDFLTPNIHDTSDFALSFFYTILEPDVGYIKAIITCAILILALVNRCKTTG